MDRPDYDSIRTTAQAEEKIQEAHQSLEELVREHERVKDAKAAAMKRFNADISEVVERMEGQLRVLDALRDRRKQVERQAELPFDKPADGDGEHLTAQDGSVLPGEEAFAARPEGDPEGGEAEGEDQSADVIPIRSSAMMTDGLDFEEEDDGLLPFDDDELASLTEGDLDGAQRHYAQRTGCGEQVAEEEVRAWRAAQQPA